MHEIEIKSGTIVACFLKNYEDEEPQLGCVTQFNKGDLDVELEWMVGAYSEAWSLWKKKKGKQYETWRERVPLSSMLFPVEINRNNRLSARTISLLIVQ